MCVIKKLKQGKIKIKPREDKTEQQHITKHKLQTTVSCLGKKNTWTTYLLKAQFAVAQALDQWQLNTPVQEGNPLVPEEPASNSFDQEHLQELLPE